MTHTTTATRTKAPHAPAPAPMPDDAVLSPAASERPAAATTAPATRTPHLRFALNPPKIEIFFARAKEKGVTVTLVTDAGTLTDLVPVKINPKSYSVQNGHTFTVAKAAVKRIEYLA